MSWLATQTFLQTLEPMVHVGRPLAVFGFALGAMLGSAAAANEAPALPRVEGELTGNLTRLWGMDVPKLAWKLELQPADAQQRARLVVEGAGTILSAELRLDSADSATWRIIEARADVARWSSVLAARLGAEFSTLAASGSVRLEGEGTWREGQIGGRVYASVSEGRLELAEHKLLLEGLALEFVMEDMAAGRSAPAQMISWTGGHFDTLMLGPGRIMFSLLGENVQIDEGVIDMLGGQVALAAVTFSIGKPEMTLITRAVGIDVTMLIPLLPPFLSEAKGELDGTLMFRRTAQGIALTAGELSLRQGGDAQLRLLPSPGLITDRVPAEILKHVPGLKKIETGEVPIKADRLDVSFTPEGDEQGRSAVMHLVGGPIDPSLKAPIDLTVNFRGPVEWLVKFGADSRLRMGGNR